MNWADYTRVFLVLVLTLVVWGLVLPYLISAKSNELLAIAGITLFVFFPVAWWIVKPTVGKFFNNNKKETVNE